MPAKSDRMALLDALDKRYDKGPSYDSHTRDLILDGVLPEWLVRGAVYGKGALKDRCARLVKELTEIHRPVLAQFAREGAGGG